MARRIPNKEAIILAIDIGKNSSEVDSNGKTFFEQTLYCISMIVQRKLLAESKDHLALILFGSSQTNNPFSTEGNCYKNIEIVTNLGIVTWDLAKYVATDISFTDIPTSDWLSTLVVAMDMLKNDIDSGLIYTDSQIVLFSNFSSDISSDKVDVIINSIKHQNLKLSLIGKDYEDILSCNPILKKFVSEIKEHTTAVNFEAVLPHLSNFKPREVNPRPWNVLLSFGNVFGIKVSGYKKVDEVPKVFKWLLCKNYDEEDSISNIKKETSFYYVENGIKKNVNRDDLLDGFRFGDTIVPFSDIEKNAYDYKSGPKSLQVLGFEKARNIQRSWFMDGGSYIYKPDEGSFVAFEALFKAMVQREEVMIVRKVYMMNCMPIIGAMFPQSEESENYFVFVSLPYAQDQRLFKLPSLKSIKPNNKQKNAIHNLIDAMELDNDDEDGLFMPENTFNPELQHMYYCIIQKAIYKDKLLSTNIPEFIQGLLNPPKIIMENAKQYINEIKELFPLESKVDKKEVVNKNILSSFVPSSLDHNDEEENLEKSCVITAFSPVEDFNKLLENGIDPEIVCQTMKKVTVELIESSCSLEELKKPASNLKALREFYIDSKDANSYNTWMYLVKDSVILSGKEELWSQFIDSGIGLITNQELEGSDISQELSEEFMKYELPDNIVAEFIIDDDDPLKEFL